MTYNDLHVTTLAYLTDAADHTDLHQDTIDSIWGYMTYMEGLMENFPTVDYTELRGTLEDYIAHYDTTETHIDPTFAYTAVQDYLLYVEALH